MISGVALSTFFTVITAQAIFEDRLSTQCSDDVMKLGQIIHSLTQNEEKQNIRLKEQDELIDAQNKRQFEQEKNIQKLESMLSELQESHKNVSQELIHLKEQGSPEVIAFSAYATTNLNFEKWGYCDVIFNETYFNFGNAYNNNDGYFTAPSDGLYVFSWSIVVKKRTLFDSQIEVNGQTKGTLACNNEWNDSFQSCSNTTPSNLRKTIRSETAEDTGNLLRLNIKDEKIITGQGYVSSGNK